MYNFCLDELMIWAEEERENYYEFDDTEFKAGSLSVLEDLKAHIEFLKETYANIKEGTND